MSRRKTAAAVAVEENAIEDNSILSPLEVPERDRDSYWNGLLNDLDLLRASIATIEFFPLLTALPKALWEKRLLVYLYRTSPKVKNQAGDKSYIEKISGPFDEEYMKNNHGGGSYTAYLNLDRETQLKQTSFSIDGPPKLIAGQTLVDSQGNVLPMPQTPAANAQTEASQVIAAAGEVQRGSMEMLTKAADDAMELQKKVFEKSAGLLPNSSQDKMLELLLARALAPQPDPMVAALTMMEKMDSIIARRMPHEETRQEKEATPLNETLQTVELLTGKSMPDLMKNRGGGETGPDWIGAAISAASKLIDNLPAIISNIGLNQERAFARQVEIARIRAGQLPAAQPPTVDAVPVTVAPGARVAAPPAAPFTPGAPATPTNGVAPVDPNDPVQSIPLIVKFVREKFEANYSGNAVAQALDVLFPNFLDQFGPVVLNEQEFTKFLAGVPDLASCLTHPDWPEFRAQFVQFIGEELSEDIGDEKPKAVTMQAATA